MVLAAGSSLARNNPAKIVGPNACAECHKHETEIWKRTHHFSSDRNLGHYKNTRSIARRMGIRSIFAKSVCTNCHLTNQAKGGRTRAIAGVSCESCHSAGADWVKVHGSFSGGKKKNTESPAEAKARWAKSESAGMIRRANIRALAKNCFGCHVVSHEMLINVGGHSAGSDFELVAWSQGEVRHNVWYCGDKKNRPADLKRKRLMYVVGMAVGLEVALRAVGKATHRETYAVVTSRRAAAAWARSATLAKALRNVPELAQIAAAGVSADLKHNNRKQLFAAADEIAEATKQIASKYDGSTFGAIDELLPGPEKFKGKPVPWGRLPSLKAGTCLGRGVP